MPKGLSVFLSFLFYVCALVPSHAGDRPVILDSIKLPPGFHIDIYAAGLDDARSMVLSPKGVLFVGTRKMGGNVYAVVDTDGDNRADRSYTIARDLDMPNGVAFRDGSLYVAEAGRILRFDNIEDHLADPPTPVVVYDNIPHHPERHHAWKYLAFGPDDWLYFGTGAPCNICEADDPHSGIFRVSADGRHGELFARGVRNTVGFAWHPDTKQMWFTDNGRDMLGDDIPDDELNFAEGLGEHFGFPYCYGHNVPDPEFNDAQKCQGAKPPVQGLGAHVAALGMKFYTGTMFPPQYRGQIFIAEHGSWNRSSKVGYVVARVKLDGNKAVEYKPFATGWLKRGGKVWGRPVDILIMPDGAMLVSDDYAGVIYRISYEDS